FKAQATISPRTNLSGHQEVRVRQEISDLTVQTQELKFTEEEARVYKSLVDTAGAGFDFDMAEARPDPEVLYNATDELIRNPTKYSSAFKPRLVVTTHLGLQELP
ncbi:hypothetical protein LTS18_006422, partial [Coniosporium uncinatum]